MKEKCLQFCENAVPVLMGIYVFLNPYPATAIKEICFYTSVVFVVALVAVKRIRISLRTPLSLPFLLFLIWAVVTVFFALDVRNSIDDVYGHLLKYLFIYFILVHFFASEHRFMILAWILIVSSTLFAAGCWIAYYLVADYPFANRLGIGFNVVHTNLIALIATSSLLLTLNQLLQERRRNCLLFLSIAILILLTAILMTQTRSALVGLTLGLVILLTYRFKKVMIAVILFLSVVIFMTPLKDRFTLDTIARNERISTNLVTLEIIKDYPITGIGFGMRTYDNEAFLQNYYDRVPPEYRHWLLIKHPHNILLDTAVRTGLVGLALFLYVIVSYVRMNWSLVRRGGRPFIREWGRCLLAASATVFVEGLFEPTLSHYPAITLYVILAMTTILWRLDAGDAGTTG